MSSKKYSEEEIMQKVALGKPTYLADPFCW
jgi:hypothetical protein